MTYTMMTVRAADGTELAVGAHPCAGEGPVVLVLHGLFSHMGWYRTLAEELSSTGAAVYLLDRRGAGRSQGPRGHMRSWTIVVDDVARVAHELAGLHPGRALHVLGISLGGTVALAAAILHPTLFTSQILLSPGLAAGFRFPFRHRLRLLQSSLLRPTTLFELPFAVEALTDHPAWQTALAGDPLRTRHVTARFLVETFRMQQFVRARMHRIELPLLVLLAEHDDLVDNDVTLAALRRARSRRVRVEVFLGASHVLPASVPQPELLGRFASWLRQTRPGQQEELTVVAVAPFAADPTMTFDPPVLAHSVLEGGPP